MKFNYTLKDPDALIETGYNALSLDLKKLGIRYEKVSEFERKWFQNNKYIYTEKWHRNGEYVRIEIDTEEGKVDKLGVIESSSF